MFNFESDSEIYPTSLLQLWNFVHWCVMYFQSKIRPVQSKLPNIYTELGVDYDQVVLPSITNEVLKAVVAKYNAEELITERTTVTNEITKALTTRAKNFKWVKHLKYFLPWQMTNLFYYLSISGFRIAFSWMSWSKNWCQIRFQSNINFRPFIFQYRVTIFELLIFNRFQNGFATYCVFKKINVRVSRCPSFFVQFWSPHSEGVRTVFSPAW